MLSKIKRFIDEKMAPDAGGTHSADAIRLAAAALLVEMMLMDKQEDDLEREVVARILRERFDLSEPEAHELMVLGRKKAGGAAEYYKFTSRINKAFSMPEKEEMIEYLWQVAYADGQLHRHEEHLVRKIAGLVGVSQKAFIAAKHRARDGG